jgi:hypothetical protein
VTTVNRGYRTTDEVQSGHCFPDLLPDSPREARHASFFIKAPAPGIGDADRGV